MKQTPELPAVPSKDQIALLAPFDRLNLHAITLVHTAAQAHAACNRLLTETALGFDTESKPTFVRDEVSTGPHIVQLSTAHHATIFQLHEPECCAVISQFLATYTGIQAGFGLGDDMRRIASKLGVQSPNVLDMNRVFHQLGYHKDMGVKAAVALLFNQRYLKSKKAATSNWANPHLTEAQITYAANDAYAAMRVFARLEALGWMQTYRTLAR
jgi:ribonuclease D